jgi:hypothetical protein
MKAHPKFKGASITLVFGKWVRPHIGFGCYSFRICLGFVALTFYWLDLERFVDYLRSGR